MHFGRIRQHFCSEQIQTTLTRLLNTKHVRVHLKNSKALLLRHLILVQLQHSSEQNLSWFPTLPLNKYYPRAIIYQPNSLFFISTEYVFNNNNCTLVVISLWRPLLLSQCRRYFQFWWQIFYNYGLFFICFIWSVCFTVHKC